MKSIPRLDARTRERLEPIRGMPPDLIDLPDMCPFAPRCAFALPECLEPVQLVAVGNERMSACRRQELLAEMAGAARD